MASQPWDAVLSLSNPDDGADPGPFEDNISDHTADSHLGTPGLNRVAYDKPSETSSRSSRVPSNPSSMRKRKQNAMDKVMEITLANHDAHLQLVQWSLQGQTDNEQVKQQALIEMEHMHLEADKERHQEEREHELLMLDRKLSFQWVMGDFHERVNQVSSPSTSFDQSGLGQDDFTPMGSGSMLGGGLDESGLFPFSLPDHDL